MLEQLKIQNYALISDIEIELSDGFVVITGETGAGKSILLGALGLILGNRVDNSIFRNNQSKCVIEGIFNTSNEYKDFFELNELDFSISTIIRREIYPDGRSRAFINDTPVQLNILKEFSERMIDIHSQHQTIRLNDTAFQLALLDSYAQNSVLLGKFKELYKQHSLLQRKINQLREAEKKAKSDFDYLSFQLEEIDKAELNQGEDKLLEEELDILTHAEKIQSSLSVVLSMLYDEEDSINNKLSEVVKLLGQVSKFSSGLEAKQQRLAEIIPEIRDISNEISSFLATVETDNQKLEEINNRLTLINHLLSKHQITNVNDLLSYANDIRNRLHGITSMGDELSMLMQQADEMFTTLRLLSDEISMQRKSVIPQLTNNLVELLQGVGMKNASIEFNLTEVDYQEMDETGRDKLNILFSSNKGVPMLPVNKVASGGELSRLMLCMKYILTESALLPTIIFDEIDMGISGEVAIQVGKMIKRLSSSHQVICITHLPQIAAMAKQHLMVYKTTDNDLTTTQIKYLEGNEKVIEIAKMIGGNQPAEIHISSSKQLINQLTHL